MAVLVLAGQVNSGVRAHRLIFLHRATVFVSGLWGRVFLHSCIGLEGREPRSHSLGVTVL